MPGVLSLPDSLLVTDSTEGGGSAGASCCLVGVPTSDAGYSIHGLEARATGSLRRCFFHLGVELGGDGLVGGGGGGGGEVRGFGGGVVEELLLLQTLHAL